ncbi:MAG: ABC-F family ATP-binding cassette domain-containing protein [Myxococcota bacterium]
MYLIKVDNLEKAYGDRMLFEGVDLILNDGEKAGIVGVNGAGKSTLMRLLAGGEDPDDGEIMYHNGMRLEYLTQRPEMSEASTALEQVLAEGPEEFEVVRAYEEVSRQLEETPGDRDLLDKMTTLSAKMDRVDGWSLEQDAKAMLDRVGISDFDAPIAEMSGGQKKRVALARALMRPCDLLMMDEPTNHLDVETVEWLEGYLKSRSGGLLLITHDRYFLDRVTGVIFEVADEDVFRYEGNYSYYLEKKAERQEQARKREEKRKNLARQELEWLRRGPKARTSKSKHRVEKANELINADYSPNETDDVDIDTLESRLGKKTVVLDGVSKSYGDNTVIEDFTYNFPRDDRVGIIGPNGAGKTTLLEMATGRLEPDSGNVEIGETIVFGYYDQESMDLDEAERVHDYIVSISNRVETEDGYLSATQMLEKFLFDRDRQWDYIEKLSGGERRRLYLLGVLMRSPNFLILDEPTNDLDVDTLNVLEEFLDSFSGVLVVVSHDRHFLDRTVDHLLVMDAEGGVEEFPGSYSAWAEHRKEETRRLSAERRALETEQRKKNQAKDAAAAKKRKGLSYKEKKEFEELEERIETIETHLSLLEEEMAEQAADYEKMRELEEERVSLEAELEVKFERWAELAELAE